MEAKVDGSTQPPRVVQRLSAPRGPLAPWGTIRRFMGDTNVCDAERKAAIEKQICVMILRSGLSLGFAENPHFQNLVQLLCPAYAKTSNPYPGQYILTCIILVLCYILLYLISCDFCK